MAGAGIVFKTVANLHDDEVSKVFFWVIRRLVSRYTVTGGSGKSDEVWSVVYQQEGELSCHQNLEKFNLK